MKNMRSISEELAKAFIDSRLNELYNDNSGELFIGIRNGYLNIYYKSKSICKVRLDKGKGVSCEIAKKYLYGEGRGTVKGMEAEEIYKRYAGIKEEIDKESKTDPEKTAQQQLVLNNNGNALSNWYCIDIEYVRQRESSNEKKFGRFDIIAVSRKSPHRVALIELKYGSSAFSGSSGIFKHVSDFVGFMEQDLYETHLRDEIIKIIESRKKLSGDCPLSIADRNELGERPEFYFITLDCAKKGEESSAKQTMAGYIFNKQNRKTYIHNARRTSIYNVEDTFGDITDPNNKRLHAIFLFSDERIDNLTINDIIDADYDRDF